MVRKRLTNYPPKKLGVRRATFYGLNKWSPGGSWPRTTVGIQYQLEKIRLGGDGARLPAFERGEVERDEPAGSVDLGLVEVTNLLGAAAREEERHREREASDRRAERWRKQNITIGNLVKMMKLRLKVCGDAPGSQRANHYVELLDDLIVVYSRKMVAYFQ